MATQNKVFLTGNLGSEPESRETASGKLVTKIQVATNRLTKVENDFIETAEWHTVTCFEKEAEYVKNYAHKGNTIVLEGSLRPNKWTDKDGFAHNTIEIICEKVVYLSKSKE